MKKNNNCGIYAIVNKVNCKIYVGSSKNLSKRRITHFYQLRKNIHKNAYIQQSFSKYGEKNFEWKILEYCKEEKLIEREQYYMNYYNSTNRDCGYNLSLKTNRSIISEETKRKMSEAQKGKKLSPEAKEKLRVANLGKTLSEEHKKRVSMTQTGRKHSLEHIEKCRVKHIGSKRSDETKEKIRLAAIGRRASEETKKRISLSKKGKGNGCVGRIYSEETKLKMRLSHLGKVGGRKGKKCSEEMRKKISESLKKFYSNEVKNIERKETYTETRIIL